MSSCYLAGITALWLTADAWPNPQKFAFDPSSPPGPSQECAEGIPRMTGPIPFLPNTPLNDDNIGYWIEREMECVYGNYYNNVKHADYDTLTRNIRSPNQQSCFRKFDGTETCISYEQDVRRLGMIRDILDVTGGMIEVVEVNERSFKVVGNASLVLQIQIGSFQVGHAFNDQMTETFVFNDDGTLRGTILWTADDLPFDPTEWAEQTLRGMGDFLKVDHANKDQYYQIDLGHNGVRVFFAFIIFWVICAPIGMVYAAMKCCNGQKVNRYEKVNVAEADA